MRGDFIVIRSCKSFLIYDFASDLFHISHGMKIMFPSFFLTVCNVHALGGAYQKVKTN
jgi:hypothetical protein